MSGEIKHEIELALTSANHFLRQQQDALNAQFAALFQDDSEPLSEIRTRCETLLQTAQNTISRDFTLRFAELESTLCRVLTDVIRPIEQQIKMELSESGFRPGFHFPVFHGVVPHFNTRQLFSEVISRQEATDEQSTRLGVVRETFSRWLNQPDWGRGNEKSPTETVDYSVLQRALSAEVDLYCQQMAKVLAEQVDESVTAGMNTFFAEFASCLTELQTRLRESMALRQQNESVVRLMQQQLQQTVMTHGWKEKIHSFSQTYENTALDSSLLLMEPYGFIEANDIRYHQTVKAIKKALLHKGLMYRYNSKDDFGLPSSAFTICTFWLVRALFVIGEKEEARCLFDEILKCSNHLGLFSEDLDFDTKEQLGNFPQAYSHLALVNTAILFAEEDKKLSFIRP